MKPALGWLFAPLALQGVVIAVDEFRYHRKRGLPLWELVGHPLDTLTVVACVAWALLQAPTPEGLRGFFLLAVFSCVFVTKDEFVHQKVCTGGETWLHSLLFLLHPLCLGAIGWLWFHPEIEGGITVIRGQLAMLAVFGVYQTLGPIISIMSS
jgi:hypothetical protein